jgi:hypothetical protein
MGFPAVFVHAVTATFFARVISVKTIPTIGMARATSWSVPDSTPTGLPSPAALEIASSWCPAESIAVPMIRGRWSRTVKSWKSSNGTTTITHTVTATRTHRLSTVTRSSGFRPGRALSRMGLIRAKRSGTPVRSATM